ncbi:MAG: hypothetical protein IPO08_18535 [Xanthomonadales bacterium]|nr:hypothetical protein [Xanthomonadales bacterium]
MPFNRTRSILPDGTRIIDIMTPGKFTVKNPEDLGKGEFLVDILRVVDNRGIGFFYYSITDAATGIMTESYIPDH